MVWVCSAELRRWGQGPGLWVLGLGGLGFSVLGSLGGLGLRVFGVIRVYYVGFWVYRA